MITSTPVLPVMLFPALANAPLDAALFLAGRLLQLCDYRFTTVTPDTHAVILKRMGPRAARDLCEVFGWNLPFHAGLLPHRLLAALHAADALDMLPEGRLRSRIRFSTIGSRIVLHSGYPTRERDAVFFGPDTYRFVHLLRRTLAGGARLLEIGAGTGAAALSLAERYDEVVLTDINAQAVRYARINAALAGCDQVQVLCTDLATTVDGGFDAIIANPPFIIDAEHRLYRDGGELGITVALRMVEAALPLLAPDGCLVLYSGAPVVAGRDLLADALAPMLRASGRPAQYEELDVDVFGGDLANPVYSQAQVERLAVVSVIVGNTTAAPRVRQRSPVKAQANGSAWCWP
ncbi:MAG: class I SAM-dependent methyltransferase [Planctomycetes bacterium]|nr:class I SAM-dependent methyltransferase [Planctomycetota bacterium]